jgi:hypothetical protein
MYGRIGVQREERRMTEVLKELVGRRVEVWSQSATDVWTDIGVLEAGDDSWVRIRTDGGEVMCFPVFNVRYIKTLA